MKERSFLPLLIAVVIISRFPLFLGGYGTDGDAWRVAQTAQVLWNEGTYQMSRYPGYPVYEILQTPLIALGGPFTSNAASLVIFILSILLFQRVLLRWNIPHSALVLVSFAFLPILWKNSAVTMDYTWGLFGLLSSLVLVLNRKFLFAGIVLGLTAGTRMTHIVYLLPLLLLFDRQEKRRTALFAGSALLTFILWYLPVLLSPGYISMAEEFFGRTGGRSMLMSAALFFYRGIYSLGLIGWGCIGATILMQRRSLSSLKHADHGRFSFLMMMVSILLFFLLPDEREYLIPAFPFLLILLAAISTRTQFVVTSLALISFAFISIDLVDHNFGKSELKIRFAQGIVMKEYWGRIEQRAQKERISRMDFADSSFVMIGMGPVFWLENPLVLHAPDWEKEFLQETSRSLNGTERFFIYALNKEQLETVRARGYNVFYWDEMGGFLESFIGYNLSEEKIEQITAPIGK